jgi:hypothetical protein
VLLSKSGDPGRHGGAGDVVCVMQGDIPMKYMLLIYGEEAKFGKMSEAQIIEVMGAYRAYTEALQKANVIVDSSRLRDVADATSVRIAGGKTNVLNGPYAETKEQLGGYYLIDVPDIDQAISWAARCPGASYGTIEVRPLWAVE